MYKIEITYITGNSFNTYENSDFIELTWDNLDKAKECIKRIKNHYEFYQKHSDLYHRPNMNLPIGVIWDDEYRMVLLSLITDDNEEYKYCSFWTGYFETLIKAEIIFENEDNDLCYEP